MIGTDEMSSSGMDISESFRAEDLSKTDFFDFVTAPEMGIGIGVGVSLHTHPHHHHHHHERNSTTHIPNDGGSGGGDGGGGSGRGNGDMVRRVNDVGTNGNSGDPTLHAYDQFWTTDKDHSRLDSTIFEDLDRYCWQQHQQQQQQLHSPSQTHLPALASPSSPTQQHQQQQHIGPSSRANSNSSTNNVSGNAESGSSSGRISQPSSTGTSSSIENTDGQIYTITVLNGNEPWLKRESDSNQLPSSLDLDSLLGTFPGYIKSEYPYDDSGFSTDGTKDNSDGSGISIPQLTTPHNLSSGVSAGSNVGPSLPSLVTTISVGSGSAGIGGTATNLQQQFAQFQNNNNDWHMADNNAEQNSAESLLRSALQGKGYSKGLHMSSGITLLPASPNVKDDDIRRMLFSSETDTLGFADSTLNAVQIFEDTQNAAHNPHTAIQLQHTTTNRPPSSTNASPSTTVPSTASIIVDDMFLSLESAFSDDFEKIKRIASEVQHFCTSSPTVTDFPGSDVLMQISPSATALQQLHSPATTPTGAQGTGIQQHIQQVTHSPPPPPPQPLKSEVTTSTSANRTAVVAAVGTKTKKYKRSTSSASGAAAAHNNNNPNVLNHNNSISNNSNSIMNAKGNGNGNGSSNSNKGSSNINNGLVGGHSGNAANSNSPTHCNGQRKERSLHYCSICSKGFKDKYSVNVHIRTHTGEKPFACSLCGKSFRQKAHLAKHYQTHMAQKSNGSLVKGSGGNSSRHHRANGGGGAATPNMGLAVVGGGGIGNSPTIAVSPAILPPHRQMGSLVSSATAGMTISNGPANALPPTNAIIANR